MRQTVPCHQVSRLTSYRATFGENDSAKNLVLSCDGFILSISGGKVPGQCRHNHRVEYERLTGDLPSMVWAPSRLSCIFAPYIMRCA